MLRRLSRQNAGVSTSGSKTFAAALDEAMRVREMSLSNLRDRLADVGHPVSLATLSYWRAGFREPMRRRSLEALPELERLVGVGAGCLTELLDTSAPGRSPRPFDELVPGRGPRLFDELAHQPREEQVIGETDVNRILFHLVVDVGAGREIVRARVTQVFVAQRSGVDGVTIFVGPDENASDVTITLRAIGGCSIGEARDASRGITATRLQFDRPLQKAESVMIEYEAVPADGLDLETEYGLVAEQRLEEAMVWVRFHPDCLPARTWVWFDEDGLRHDWQADLAGSTGLHYRQTAFGPGSLGARWEW